MVYFYGICSLLGKLIRRHRKEKRISIFSKMEFFRGAPSAERQETVTILSGQNNLNFTRQTNYLCMSFRIIATIARIFSIDIGIK